jgi:DNA-binding NarL/FixJ family response regulator
VLEHESRLHFSSASATRYANKCRAPDPENLGREIAAMEPISVMLVDDSHLFLGAATEFLKAQKDVVVVGTANGGQEALVKAQDLQPQVVLIDMAMPGMPGLEAIGHLKRLLPNTAIIALTVMDTKSFRQAALAAGADDFISKSAMRASLLPAIRKIAKNHHKKLRLQVVPAESQRDEAITSQPVLLMEDDASQRRLYAKVLRKAGYEVYEAATLQEARDSLAQAHFGVFLCDIHMGQERGTDLLREQGDALRKNGTQIIVVSADSRYRSIAEDMGVEFYLEKPVSIASLVTLMNRLTAQG